MADEPIELLGGEGTAVDPPQPLRRPARDHALELPLLPGGPVRRPEPGDRQHDPAQARAAVPGIGRGDRRRSSTTPAFPEGVYENIYATNEQIEWVIADPRVHGVSVTGSERAGAAVAEIAGRNLKKVVLELGGSDPFILLGTDDLDATRRRPRPKRGSTTPASPATPPSASSSSTSSTTSSSRSSRSSWAPRSRATRPPRTPRSARSPRRRAADRLEDQVKRAVDNGAEVVVGGKRDGNYFEPTILTGIEPGDEASQEEFFGPVAQVYRVGSEEEAVELANQTPFGLGSYLMTTDKEQAERVAEPDRSRDGLRQPGRRRQPRAAVRRLQALRLRPRARPLRRRRVRQQEADPQRLIGRGNRALSVLTAFLHRRCESSGERPATRDTLRRSVGG